MEKRSERGFAEIAIIIVVVVLIAAAGLYAYKHNQDVKQAQSTSNLPTASKNQRPGTITGLQFSPSVDAKGMAVGPKAVFAPSEAKINAVIALKNAPKDTRIEYVRYRNDKFVDNGSLKITKDKAQTAGFDFVTKPGKTHPKGKYKVKVYANGVYERAADYSIQ